MKFTKRQEEDFSLHLTPLVDVVFLLLIFFMVSTVFVDFSRQMGIELPETSSTGAGTPRDNFVTIEVDRGGAIFLDGEAVTLEGLRLKLESVQLGRMRGKGEALVRADKRVEYGTAVAVMDVCRNAGFGNIGLTVLPK